jgi:hypothetical protein
MPKLDAVKVRLALTVAITIGEMLAPRTESKIDDLAVEKLKALQANENALAFLIALLSGEPATLANAKATDLELAQGVANHEGARQLIELAASTLY